MIRIEVDSRQPPAGRFASDDGPVQPFQGWLELLHLLTDALEPQGADADPRPPGAR